MINIDVGHWVFVVTNARPIIGKVISWDLDDPNFKVYTVKTIKGQIHKVKEYPYTFNYDELDGSEVLVFRLIYTILTAITFIVGLVLACIF